MGNAIVVMNSPADQESLFLTIGAVTSFLNTLEPSDPPIYLAFNSEGGDSVFGLGLHYFIKGIDHRITAVNLGKCCSATILPYLSCDRRIAVPDSIFGIHHEFKVENDKTTKINGLYQKLQRYYLPKIPEIEEALDDIDPVRIFGSENFYDNGIVVDEVVSKDSIFTAGSVVLTVKDGTVNKDVI